MAFNRLDSASKLTSDKVKFDVELLKQQEIFNSTFSLFRWNGTAQTDGYQQTSSTTFSGLWRGAGFLTAPILDIIFQVNGNGGATVDVEIDLTRRPDLTSFTVFSASYASGFSTNITPTINLATEMGDDYFLSFGDPFIIVVKAKRTGGTNVEVRINGGPLLVTE